jgi:SpoVK/Ycf46/Vps4 family AAA+-type ATPase
VCATNFVDTIDPAVLRPGRFDLLIGIGPPDLEALTALWAQALASLDLDGDDRPRLLADRSRGFTPGDIDLAAQRAAAVVFARSRTGEGSSVSASRDLEAALARTRPSISPRCRSASTRSSTSTSGSEVRSGPLVAGGQPAAGPMARRSASPQSPATW